MADISCSVFPSVSFAARAKWKGGTEATEQGTGQIE